MIIHLKLPRQYKIKGKYVYFFGIWFIWKQSCFDRLAKETRIGFAWPQLVSEASSLRCLQYAKLYDWQ